MVTGLAHPDAAQDLGNDLRTPKESSINRRSNRRHVGHFDVVVAGNRVDIIGDVDVTTAPRLAAALARVVDDHDEVIIDASNVDVFGTAATCVLEQCMRRLGTPGSLTVSNPTETVQRVLEILGLADLVVETGS